MCGMCSKLKIRIPGVFIWTYFTPFSSVSVADFEQVNVGWEVALVSILNLALDWGGGASLSGNGYSKIDMKDRYFY